MDDKVLGLDQILHPNPSPVPVVDICEWPPQHSLPSNKQPLLAFVLLKKLTSLLSFRTHVLESIQAVESLSLATVIGLGQTRDLNQSNPHKSQDLCLQCWFKVAGSSMVDGVLICNT